MTDPEIPPEAVKTVRAERIFAGPGQEPANPEDVYVVEETALAIDVEGIETYTLLCTPTDRLALAAGFLFTEGVIDRPQDIRVLKVCDSDPDTIRVRLVERIPRIGDAGRNLLIVSACGVCGSENLKERIAALPAVGTTLSIKPDLLHSVQRGLADRQELFAVCGGTHAAALFSETGEIVASAEDAGRHNALDKAIGKCFLDGIATAGRGAALTSRLSLEMVSKCARAGIELIAAVSAPTALAITVADACNITLCAFVRDDRATVFTHPGRIDIGRA